MKPPISVSKPLAKVSIVVEPLAVAVHVHQTEAPPRLPPTNVGSPPPPKPNCLVAVKLLPVVLTTGPNKGIALGNWSLLWANDRPERQTRAAAAINKATVFIQGIRFASITRKRDEKPAKFFFFLGGSFHPRL